MFLNCWWRGVDSRAAVDDCRHDYFSDYGCSGFLPANENEHVSKPDSDVIRPESSGPKKTYQPFFLRMSVMASSMRFSNKSVFFS